MLSKFSNKKTPKNFGTFLFENKDFYEKERFSWNGG